MKKIIIYTDGGSRGNPGPAAIGVIVLCEGQAVFEQASTIGVATNNQAEYRALLESIKWLLKHQNHLSPTLVTWRLDSRLVIEQVNQNWKIKLPHLKKMAQEAWIGLNKLKCQYVIEFVPREKNVLADALVNQALDAE